MLQWLKPQWQQRTLYASRGRILPKRALSNGTRQVRHGTRYHRVIVACDYCIRQKLNRHQVDRVTVPGYTSGLPKQLNTGMALHTSS